MLRKLASILLLLTTIALSEPIQVIEKKGARGVDISLRNHSPGPITVRVEFDLSNLTTSRPLPSTVVVPAGGLVDFTRLRMRNNAAWNYNYRYKWRFGDCQARHSRDYLYRLPYRGSFRVVQGANGRFSHSGESAQAIDFNLPEGTPVLAARGGYVVEAKGHFREGRPDRALYEKANRVLIAHADGSIGDYQHFRYRGVEVREGQRVEPGTLLGYSGNTGFSAGPHLHIAVWKPAGDAKARIPLPIRFTTAQGDGEVREGRTYSPR